MSASHSNRRIPTVQTARVSSKGQQSIPTQLDWGKTVAELDNLDIRQTFCEQGEKGHELEYRQEIKNLVTFCEQQLRAGDPIEVLLTYDADRFSRNDSIDTNAVLSDLRKYGVTRIRHGAGWIDLNNDMDRVMFNLTQDLKNAAFCPGHSRRVLDGQAKQAREGYWMGGPAPFGYRIQGGKLVPGPEEEVKWAKWIFATYATGKSSLRKLARELDDHGVKPPGKAKRWRDATIWVILHNRTYIGDYIWNDRHQGKFNRLAGGQVVTSNLGEREQARRRSGRKHLPVETNALEDRIFIPGCYPAIVDLTIFDNVQRLMPGKQTKTAPARTNIWPLSGMLYCGHCGAPLWGKPDSGHQKGRKTPVRQRLICSSRKEDAANANPLCGRADLHEVLRRVVLILQKHLGNREAVAAIRDEVTRKASTARGDLESQFREVNNRIAELDRKIAADADTYLDTPPELRSEVGKAMSRRKTERETLDTRRETILGQIRATAMKADEERIDRAVSLVGELHDLLDVAKWPLLRDALQSLLARVECFFELLPDKRPNRSKMPRQRPRWMLRRVELTLHPNLGQLAQYGRLQ